MARGHGEMSGEIEQEAGDLQSALVIVWAALTDYQQEVLHKKIVDEVFNGDGSEYLDDITLEPEPSNGSGSVRS